MANMADDFFDGTACIVRDGKESYIDKKGKWYDEKPKE